MALPKVLLRSELGGGLNVVLLFRNGVTAVAFHGAMSAYVVMKNMGDQAVRWVIDTFYFDFV